MPAQLPVFATNRPVRGESVATAVKDLFRAMRQGLADPPPVAIATAYINAAGFNLVADELEQADEVRLLLGAEPDPATDHALQSAAADRDERLDKALASHQTWVTMQRNLMGFTRQSSKEAHRLLQWLASTRSDGTPKVQVRRYTEGFLHGKCYLVEGGFLSATLAGSSNFTFAGLSRNAELNLGASGNPGHVGLVGEWFDELWDASEPYDLAGVYSALWQPHTPWVVFLRMLHELYGNAPDEERPRTELHLTGFQLDGVSRMLRLLDSHGGVLVADEVGLGKTFLAGEVIARASAIDRQHVLIVTPAALKASMWEPFLNRFDFSRRVVVYSFDELRRRSDPDDPGVAAFLRELDDYALVVVDEAHNLRNPNTQRSAAVSALLGGSRPKKVVLLTATPVNNTLMDLHTLVSYFIRNDAEFTPIGIPSIRGYIKHAQEMDPESLSPEHLFDLMDQVAVRRTRRFVQRFYPHDTIVQPDGSIATISFPTPRPRRIDYTLDASGEALLDAVVYALDLPDATPMVSSYQQRHDDPNRLMMARYAPSGYAKNLELDSSQISNVGLLRSALLKRLESSPAALKRTLGTLITSHEQFLRALDLGYVMTSAALNEWSGSEDEDLDDWVAQLDTDLKQGTKAVAEFHEAELREDVVNDLDLLGRLRTLAEAAGATSDPKAAQLIEQLRTIAAEARRPSRDGLTPADRRKVLVFSTFADTIDDIARRATAAVTAAPSTDPLSDYQDRIAGVVKGQKAGADQEQRARLLAGFAPETAGDLDGDGQPNSGNLYDLLFTTDVLSEGVNLQQCGKIINYDLPWNPMRLVQRHGRVDRIGSKHPEVMLGCFFPSEHLDDLLGLEATLQRKLAYADAAIGVGDVLPGSQGRFQVTLEDTQAQIKAIAEENPQLFLDGGTRSAALSGEEYRKRLTSAMDNPYTKEGITKLPWMAGSGFTNSLAPRSGYVFCLRMGNQGNTKPWFRFVPVNPDTWEPMRGQPNTGSGWTTTGQDDATDDDQVIVGADTLTCLMTADPGNENTARDLPDHVYEQAFNAYAAARDAALADWMVLTDPNELMPEVPKALRDAAELVYEHGATALNPSEQGELLGRLNTSPPNRVIKDVRALLNNDGLTPAEKILAIHKVADSAGLTPPTPAEPLPPLEKEDIHLIAWMAVRGTDATTGNLQRPPEEFPSG